MKTFKELFAERCKQEPDYEANKEDVEAIMNDEMFKMFEEIAEKYKNQAKDEPTTVSGP
jgi:hypothetical protein